MILHSGYDCCKWKLMLTEVITRKIMREEISYDNPNWLSASQWALDIGTWIHSEIQRNNPQVWYSEH